jgi:hypothetical protein
MTTESKSTGAVQVMLGDEERAELARILETALADIRVEIHRTHTPDFRDQVQRREAVLRGLANKLRQAGV